MPIISLSLSLYLPPTHSLFSFLLFFFFFFFNKIQSKGHDLTLNLLRQCNRVEKWEEDKTGKTKKRGGYYKWRARVHTCSVSAGHNTQCILGGASKIFYLLLPSPCGCCCYCCCCCCYIYIFFFVFFFFSLFLLSPLCRRCRKCARGRNDYFLSLSLGQEVELSSRRNCCSSLKKEEKKK